MNPARLSIGVVLLAALLPCLATAGLPAELNGLLERSLVEKHSGGDPVRGNYEDRTDAFRNVSDGRQIVITTVEALLLNPEQVRFADLEASNYLLAQAAASRRYPLFGHWGTCFWEFPGGIPALDVPPVNWVGAEFHGLSLPVTLNAGETLVLNTVARNDVMGPVNPQPADVGELIIGWRFFGRVTPMTCGNGVVNPPEACDDGNYENADDCRIDCTLPLCGDETLDAHKGETCDPPGSAVAPHGHMCRRNCTVCGDSQVNGTQRSPEDCDDGNSIDNDGCRNDCTVPICGDSILDAGETCDPPGAPAGGAGNNCRTDCTVCGDGFSNSENEDCDDGNDVDDDDCRNDCTTPVCGDFRLDPGETCEPPGDPAGVNDNVCRTNCTVCGDGLRNSGEDCDDGNTDNNDGCRNNCATPDCGDGVIDLDRGETCERPGDIVGPADQVCRGDCTLCGDTIVDLGEECDDGNARDLDGCRNNCLLPLCGDGLISDAIGETCEPPGQPAGGNGNNCRGDCTVCGDGVTDNLEGCDDANGIDDDGCRNDCTLPGCGDGIVDDGEECDDGNTIPGDACRNDCTAPRCGDGIVDTGEACDDGNGIDDDSCRNDCTMPGCGDGTVDAGEECDDGNDIDNDACRNNCTAPRCGDGIVDAGETCDDGNGIDDDACRNDCSAPVCGDSRLDAGETCDPPGTPAGGNGNNCREGCTVCGDGNLDAAEACDDGNGIDDDACRNDCTMPGCGDGTVDAGEECDDGNDIDDDACRNNCTAPRCGDGIVDAGEACDDGNDDDNDACRNDCSAPVCGDSRLDAGETCDPPGTAAGGNGNNCRESCTVCGDGNLDAAEACDDGNGIDDDACRNDCTMPGCGDGTVDAGEECDDGNGIDDDACRNNCTAPRCGDGIVDAGEACDDGNDDGDDACRNDCTVPSCGDGRLDSDETCDPPGDPAGGNGNLCRSDCRVCGDGNVEDGEVCDDGNGIDDDACRNDCTPPVCGDGRIDAGETCDPPGDPAGGNGNDCRGDCTVCGDGNPDPGEACDDGNGIDDDACRNDCTVPVCGDGRLDTGETCDPPGTPAGAGGNDCRADCTVCGDGNLDPREACDDGNTDEADLCRNNCTLTANCEVDEDCDDGLFCSGVERCDAGSGDCAAGTPVDCNDGVTCTTDTCNEAADSCANVPEDSACDNGLFCDGAEVCDPVADCQPGADPCAGGPCSEAEDTCPPAPQPQMEWGRVEAVGGTATTVALIHTYVDPVVVASINYSNNTIPVVTRIRNVTGSSFEVFLQNPSGDAVAGDAVNYIVVEKGTWAMDGVSIEAQKYLSTTTADALDWSGYDPLSYSLTYSAPVVLGQVMSANDSRFSVFWSRGPARTTPPDPTILGTGKMVGEDPQTDRLDETLGVIVIEGGHRFIGGIEMEARLSPDTVAGTVNGAPFPVSFATPFPQAPQVAVAVQAGMDGNNGGWVYTFGPVQTTPTRINLSGDEDQIGDVERSRTTEQVSYFVFQTPGSFPPVAP